MTYTGGWVDKCFLDTINTFLLNAYFHRCLYGQEQEPKPNNFKIFKNKLKKSNSKKRFSKNKSSIVKKNVKRLNLGKKKSTVIVNLPPTPPKTPRGSLVKQNPIIQKELCYT
eukprot:Pgem_evm1s13479